MTPVQEQVVTALRRVVDQIERGESSALSITETYTGRGEIETELEIITVGEVMRVTLRSLFCDPGR